MKEPKEELTTREGDIGCGIIMIIGIICITLISIFG
jgi:hypothetical protein